MTKYRIGDTVRDENGNVSKVNDVTVLYSLDNGTTCYEEELEMIEATNNEEKIIERLCATMDTTKDEISGPSRCRIIIAKRHLIMYVLNKSYKWPQYHIAGLLNRNHSTVHFAIKHVEDMLYINDKEYVTGYKKLSIAAGC